MDYEDNVLSSKAEKIFKSKYAQTLPNGEKESWRDCVWRVSYYVASAEKEYGKGEQDVLLLAKDFYRLIINRLFVPGGRVLSNAGTDISNMFNCFVIPVEDSRQEIYRALGKSGEIFAHGGGVGYNFSKIREKGAPVKTTGGKASGPLTFMELFDATGEVISQASRRGAQMGILNCDHPDIEDFIDFKASPNAKNQRYINEFADNKSSDYDSVMAIRAILIDNQLSHFNISVGILDSFMEAVTQDKDWELKSRVTGETTRTIKARDLMRKIAESAWRSGDPGVIFLDRLEEGNMVPFLGRLEATNPCFTSDMKLLTTEGYKTFFDLATTTEKIILINSDGEESVGKVWYNGEKEVVELRLSNGNKIRSTPDHIYKTVDGSSVEARNLKGKQLHPYINKPKVDDIYAIYGFAQGDGNLTRLNSYLHRGMELNLNKKDYEVMALLDAYGYKYTKYSDRIAYVQRLKDELISLKFSAETLPKRVFPETYDEWASYEKAGFLRGCFSANGSVNNRGRITYKNTCWEFIAKLQKTLLKDFGIDSYITTNKSHPVEFSNGTYTIKESYDLNINRYDEKIKFFNKINFIQSYKTELLVKYLFEMSPYITSIRELGELDVYDFNEPKTNWGVVEGFVVHNCSEVTLLSNEPCCLGSINLAEMIEDGWISQKKLNYVTTMAVRFLDNIHTLNKTPVEEVNEAAKKTRRLGLGVMGWADLLVKVGISYDSEKALELAEEIMKSINAMAWGTSEFLAEERGPFPAFDKEKCKNIPSYPFNELAPVRNVAVTSIAPTGTIALLADVNSGIEPFFALSYTRYITEGIGNVVKDTIVELNPLVEDYIKGNNTAELTDEELESFISDFKSTGKLPESSSDALRKIFATANEIPWKAHIDMQAAFQKYTDNAISKTINMPNSATVEDVMNAYIYAWEKGLKSVALYRDNSKSFQILNK
jgi:ribonucleoside-diphosphate reductase alpha chain